MAVTGEKTRVIRFGAAADAVTGKKYVTGFNWSGGQAGDSLVVTDTANNVLWESKCGTNDNDSQIMFNEPQLVADGIKVATMGHGVLLAYLA